MKKMFCLCITLLLMLSLCSCTIDDQNDSVKFYYPKTEYDFGSTDGVIGSVKKEYGINKFSAEQIINEYLKGPENSELYSPLTGKSKLIESYTEGNTLRIVFNDSVAKVESSELTTALAALAMTCLDIFEKDEIHISAETVILNGEMTLIYTRENIMLWDSYIEEIPSSQATNIGE